LSAVDLVAPSARAAGVLTADQLAPEPVRGVHEGARLDLHEEIGGKQTTRCDRWPKRLSLISNFGQIVQGRCGSPNLCEYCARLAGVENAELLSLDAMLGEAPCSYMVLTQPSPTPEARAYYESRKQLQRLLKREIPGYQAAWLLEFTTGRAHTSGGQRRPHFNALLKGRIDELVVEQAIEQVWCAREGASPLAQYVAPVQEIGGLTRYLALHFLKQEQAPPHGWRGHRFRTTRGYLWTSTPLARKLTREQLLNKRELWRAFQDGLAGEEAEHRVESARKLRAQTTWALGFTPDYGMAVQTPDQPGVGRTDDRAKRTRLTRSAAPRTTARPGAGRPAACATKTWGGLEDDASFGN